MVFGVALASVAALVLLCAIVAALRSSRLPRSLIVEYAPARGATVLGDAVLAGLERRAAAAALLDLAVRGRVRLLTDGPNGRRRSRPTISIEVPDPDALGAADLALLDALFDSERDGRPRRFSKDARRAGRRVQDLIRREASRLRRAGLLTKDGIAGPLLLRLGVLLLIIALPTLIGSALLGAVALAIPAAVASALLIAAVIIAGRVRPRRFTAAAEPRRTHLDGLRQYMRLAEADRLRTLQSPAGAERVAVASADPASSGSAGSIGPARQSDPVERFRLHERLLPYAVIFGMEREWTKVVAIDLDGIDRAIVSSLGDIAQSAVDILQVADALGDLVDIVSSVGDVFDAAGSALDIAGAIGDLFGSWP
ncbi:DUF2207 domain-containing protein [Leifsonia shinshuensis]|uniref:DUF2207 family protein n=1 Tax=Leifsonia shinshuensis TaxID=150026 RepID=UPI001F50CD2C|nr:DUF2207 domain-containing protein [Leifsonia shinshuensis]MCI0156153.1 DUF2207 domain-containing protein [Leifsonia shinshuensis]